MKSSREALSGLARRTSEPPVSWLMAMALSHPGLVSLAAGFTDQVTLPLKETRRLIGDLLSRPLQGRAALQYGSTPGDPALRRITAERIRRLDDRARPARAGASRATDLAERLLITGGSQQLLYMLSECLCEPGDIVLVEDPTYFVYLGIVESHGLRSRGIRMEADGLDLRHLERCLAGLRRTGQIRRLKLLYLVSYFQNPTGTTTSHEKKRAALRLLARYERHAGHRLYLVEDAAYRELRFAGEDVPSALTLPGADRRVIYAGTYSKPFATGMRIGFGVLPAPLLGTVLRVKGNHDFGTSNLLQQVMRRALETGIYERHLAVLRRRYTLKAAAMTQALRRHWPSGIDWVEPRGGLYVWARLPGSIGTGPHTPFFRRALKHDVLYVPGEFCYAPDPTRPRPNHEMRLSYGGATPADIRRGIRRLADVFREFRVMVRAPMPARRRSGATQSKLRRTA